MRRSVPRSPPGAHVAVARFALAATAAAVVAVAAGFAFAAAVHHAPPAPAPVAFRNSGGYIVATVVNPNAAAPQLQAAFAAHNLNIHLKLAPVSPLVGSVVYMGTMGPSEIGTLSSAGSAGSGGSQPIGLLIPAGFKASPTSCSVAPRDRGRSTARPVVR